MKHRGGGHVDEGGRYFSGWHNSCIEGIYRAFLLCGYVCECILWLDSRIIWDIWGSRQFLVVWQALVTNRDNR